MEPNEMEPNERELVLMDEREQRKTFDEEAEEREEFRIQQLLDKFDDETPFNHNELPDSDIEDDEVTKERARNEVKRGDGCLYMKQKFISGVAFKETVIDYALGTGHNLYQYRFDKKNKLGFKCAGKKEGEEGEGCKCQVYASLLPKNSSWQISKFIDKHSCLPNGECKLLREPVITRLFMNKLREEPDYYLPMKIEQLIFDNWRISVSRHQCQNARGTALRWIAAEYDRQFARLQDYAAEIIEANPGSSVEVGTLKNDDGQDMFNRFYVCLDVLRQTWKQTCRPIIGVDGTFMKHKIKGQLLVALGKDANNGIYPIAWAAVQVENKDNWLWFLKKLKVDLDLKDGDSYVLISDRQKGLIKAVELELPKIEHRMCVKHIYENLKKVHTGKKKRMKPLLWSLAWSYSESEYLRNLERIHCYDTKVHADVLKANPKNWCRAFFKLGSFCEDVDNNFTESFNGTKKEARELPFVPMLTMISRLAMARIARRNAESHSHNGICTPYVANYLALFFEAAKECTVNLSTNGVYESKTDGCAHRVNLEQYSCTCKKWEVTGIPCVHTYGVILKKKLAVEYYVCHWFKTAKWKLNYTNGIAPTRGHDFWPKTNEADIVPPPEPAQPGRHKVNIADKTRKRGAHESPKKPKEKKRIMHCRECGSEEHNIRFHKKMDKDKSKQAVSMLLKKQVKLLKSPLVIASQVTTTQASQVTTQAS